MRFLHAADLHMDSAFAALDAEKAAKRRSEQRGLLARLAGTVKSERCDAVLLCGDMFDSSRAYAETGEALCGFIEAAAVPVFIAPGNHDWYGPSSPWAKMKLPGNAVLFTSEEPEPVYLESHGCTVWGASWLSETCPPLTGFRADGEGVNVMALHAVVGKSDKKYRTVSEEDIAASNLDYLALGHVHGFSGARRAGRTVWAYSGTPEGRGFDETGEKGVVIADVAEKNVSLRFLPMCARRYEIVEIPAGNDPESAVLRALPAGAREDVYRIVFTGETDAAPNLAALSEKLAPMYFALELRDATMPRQDIWEGMGADSLRGLFLTRMKARFDAAGDEADREIAASALRIGLAALDNRELPSQN